MNKNTKASNTYCGGVGSHNRFCFSNVFFSVGTHFCTHCDKCTQSTQLKLYVNCFVYLCMFQMFGGQDEKCFCQKV